MSGSPLRPDRASFGEVFADSTAVRDPRKQMAARYMNLALWQVAGFGLVAPRVALFFLADVAKTIFGRSETWNPYRETAGDYADPTITRTAAGNYLIEYPTSVPDENGDEQAISFSWALAFVSNDDPTTMKHGHAGVVAANRNRIRACAFSAAHALEDGNKLVVFGW
jgi:hypothetical protein